MSITTPARTLPPVTAETAMFTFYDIESLTNVFTLCAYTPRTEHIDVFYLVDRDGGELDQAIQAGLDIPTAARTIIEANPAYQGKSIAFYDLSQIRSNLTLATMMGLSDSANVNDPQQVSTYGPHLRPVCDTDSDYDPINKHPYLAGYNSANYDTVMLAMYLNEAFAHFGAAMQAGMSYDHGFKAPSAALLRRYNDQLFQEPWKTYMPRFLTDSDIARGKRWDSTPNRIRQAMINSGRHIDVARFNEVQQRVALKRLLGGLGRQIMESDKLGTHNSYVSSLQDFLDLLAYNVSDVVGLALLFKHPNYSSGFDLKKGLLEEYPETIYNNRKDSYAPDIRPGAVRRNRLTPDSSSAKFVSLILAPYSNLPDDEVVSFMYPSEKVAAERGVTPVDVLEQAKEFFYENITDEQARRQFDEVYRYYDSIRGRNFNESPEYLDLYPDPQLPGQPKHQVHYLKELPKTPNNLPYFRPDGTPTSCFATFSTGGIHGAEADVEAYADDSREHNQQVEMIRLAKLVHPDPRDFVAAARDEHNTIALPDGTTVDKRLVLLGSDPAKVSWRKPKKDDPEQNEQLARAQSQVSTAAELLARQRPKEQELFLTLDDGTVLEGKVVLAKTSGTSAEYRDAPVRKAPELFVSRPDGSTRLNPKYVYTSAETAIHEDFTSYYPNMLRNMSAFFNEPLGEDRYAKIFFDKEDYGRRMKEPGISPAERKRLNVLRDGTKLILNTASGAGDTTHYTPIRMNNKIIAMRIIGQLFSWQIGQAQALKGARIISTNTDGLYSVLDEETNNQVLAEQSARIGVDIEPEKLIVISKDSNNRLELAPVPEGTPVWKAPIIAASGGSLACHEEPQPTKSLAHPAVLDWALARYLRYIVGGYVPSWRDTPLSLEEPLDRRMGKKLLLEAIQSNDPVLAARLFQNIVSASNGKITFPFAADPVDPINPDPEAISNPRPLQHYNRVFMVHQGKPGAVSLRTAGTWVVPAASKLKRQRSNESDVITDKVALDILRANGFERDRASAVRNNRQLLPTDQDVAVRRIPGIDPSWSVLVENQDLVCMPEDQLKDLLGCLDLDVYVEMLATSYDKNWKRRELASGEEREEGEEVLDPIED